MPIAVHAWSPGQYGIHGVFPMAEGASCLFDCVITRSGMASHNDCWAFPLRTVSSTVRRQNGFVSATRIAGPWKSSFETPLKLPTNDCKITQKGKSCLPSIGSILHIVLRSEVVFISLWCQDIITGALKALLKLGIIAPTASWRVNEDRDYVSNGDTWLLENKQTIWLSFIRYLYVNIGIYTLE